MGNVDIAEAIVDALGFLSAVITIAGFLFKIWSRPRLRISAWRRARMDEKGVEVTEKIDITLE